MPKLVYRSPKCSGYGPGGIDYNTGKCKLLGLYYRKYLLLVYERVGMYFPFSSGAGEDSSSSYDSLLVKSF